MDRGVEYSAGLGLEFCRKGVDTETGNATATWLFPFWTDSGALFVFALCGLGVVLSFGLFLALNLSLCSACGFAQAPPIVGNAHKHRAHRNPQTIGVSVLA